MLIPRSKLPEDFDIFTDKAVDNAYWAVLNAQSDQGIRLSFEQLTDRMLRHLNDEPFALFLITIAPPNNPSPHPHPPFLGSGA